MTTGLFIVTWRTAQALLAFESPPEVVDQARQYLDRAELVELLRAAGLDAYRVPLSGASAGFKSMWRFRIGARTLRLESKARAHKFGLIYRWLTGSDAAVVKADRKPPLIVLTLADFASLLGQNRSQTENTAHKPLAQPSP